MAILNTLSKTKRKKNIIITSITTNSNNTNADAVGIAILKLY